jgi:hypothetical protein
MKKKLVRSKVNEVELGLSRRLFSSIMGKRRLYV